MALVHSLGRLEWQNQLHVFIDESFRRIKFLFFKIISCRRKDQLIQLFFTQPLDASNAVYSRHI